MLQEGKRPRSQVIVGSATNQNLNKTSLESEQAAMETEQVWDQTGSEDQLVLWYLDQRLARQNERGERTKAV